MCNAKRSWSSLRRCICVDFEQPVYRPGETMTGQVRIHEVLYCEGKDLNVTVDGVERISWLEIAEEDEFETSGVFNDERRICANQRLIMRDKVKLTEKAGNLHAEDWKFFSFSFTLPMGIPSTFRLTDLSTQEIEGCQASISYHLEVQLLPLETRGKSKTVKFPFIIDAQTDPRTHFDVSTSESVRFLRMFKLGTCHLSFNVASNAIHLNEPVQLSTFVRNESSVDIAYTRCFVWQELILVVNQRTIRTVQQIGFGVLPRVHAHSGVETACQFMLGLSPNEHNVSASTCGELIQCAHSLHVEFGIPWCGEVDLMLPFTVLPAPVRSPVEMSGTPTDSRSRRSLLPDTQVASTA